MTPRALAWLATTALRVSGRTCPGALDVRGHGTVALTNAAWNVPGNAAGLGELHGRSGVLARMDARVYFADTCREGAYKSSDYTALKLLGKTIRYTTDVSGTGCGCNVAFYLVSMRQNTEVSDCGDYYCDANKVCGVPCAEIDIQEASTRAWHSTLHSSKDHSGVAAGYGGGISWDGPRDFTSQQYGPGASCVDTTKPFEVAASFPVDAQDSLAAMEVTLTQRGCSLKMRLGSYEHMSELGSALAAGMTPVLSYWRSRDMLWMDGKGADAQGPCESDALRCGESVTFSNFSVEEHTSPFQEPGPSSTEPCTDSGFDCRSSRCCRQPGLQCYEKNEWWASCNETCAEGVALWDSPENRQPWSCKPLGPRTPGTSTSGPKPEPGTTQLSTTTRSPSGESGYVEIVLAVSPSVNANRIGSRVVLMAGGRNISADVVNSRSSGRLALSPASAPAPTPALRAHPSSGLNPLLTLVLLLVAMSVFGGLGVWYYFTRGPPSSCRSCQLPRSVSTEIHVSVPPGRAPKQPARPEPPLLIW